MTVEEAIRVLDPETTAEALAEIEYYAGFSGPTAKVQACSDACEVAVAALREQQKRDKGCVYCTTHQPLETDGGGELEVVQIIPLPAINLTTGQTEKSADPPYYALLFQAFEGELEDFVPIRCCPMCGRVLKED